MPRALALALRRLKRKPALAITVVVCWSLGLAAGVSTLWLADRVFFRPPIGVQQADAVVRLYSVMNDKVPGAVTATDRFTYTELGAIQAAVGRSAEIAAYGVVTGSLRGGALMQDATIGVVTPNFFKIVRVVPAVGRMLSPNDSDYAHTAEPPVVLAFATARAAFGQASAGIGKTVWLRGAAFTVIGVAPEGFTASEPIPIHAWVLTNAGGEWAAGTNWAEKQVWWLRLIGRVNAGEPTVKVAARATVGLEQRRQTSSAGRPRDQVMMASLLPSRGPLSTSLARSARWLVAGGILLLVLATANVAGLLVLRVLDRDTELRVKRALGATLYALVAELVSECVLLAIAAALAATAGAALLQRATVAALLPGLSSPDSPFSGRAIALMLASVAVAAIGATLVPIVVLSRREYGMLSTGDHASRSKHAGAARSGVIGVQVLTATLLLAATAGMVTTLRDLRSQSLGLHPERVVVATISHAYAVSHAREATNVIASLRSSVLALPGVQGVSVSAEPPMVEALGMSISTPRHPLAIELPTTGSAYYNVVDAGFFNVIGTRILRGRGFTAADQRNPSNAIIVNQTLARVVWPGQNPIGQCLILGAEAGNPCTSVVGVAEDARLFSVVPEPPTMEVYLPAPSPAKPDWAPLGTMLVHVRGDPVAEAPAVAEAIQGMVPPEVPLIVEPLEAVLDPQFRPWRTSSILFGAFGAVGLVLVALGIGGALAYDVRQRRRELAIKLALGGSHCRILGGIAWPATKSLIVGCSMAAIMGWWSLAHWAHLAYGWAGHEGGFLLVAVCGVIGSGAVAVGLAAWRISRLDVPTLLRD